MPIWYRGFTLIPAEQKSPSCTQMQERQKTNNPNAHQKKTTRVAGVREHDIQFSIMFLINDLDETYITKFNQLGITNKEDIITILNGLDEIAEIGYVWYRNNKVKNEDIYD